METIFEDEFVTFEIDTEKSLYIFSWKPTTVNITAEDLIEYGKKSVATIQKFQIKNIIGNSTHFRYLIVPGVQQQLNDNVFSKLNHGTVKKFAHVVNHEMITQMSIEQTYDENIHKTYNDKFFESLQDAINWCLE